LKESRSTLDGLLRDIERVAVAAGKRVDNDVETSQSFALGDGTQR
jgi:hypothetical protein